MKAIFFGLCYETDRYESTIDYTLPMTVRSELHQQVGAARVWRAFPLKAFQCRAGISIMIERRKASTHSLC